MTRYSTNTLINRIIFFAVNTGENKADLSNRAHIEISYTGLINMYVRSSSERRWALIEASCGITVLSALRHCP